MFSHAPLSSLFKTVKGEAAPFIMVHNQCLYALFISTLVLEKHFLEGSN